MKTITVLLAVVSLLSICQASQAADLQPGWYVNIYSVGIFVPGVSGPPDWGMPRSLGSACFYNTSPGQYGPFYVSDGQYHTNTERGITVPYNALGVGAEDSFVLPLSLGMTLGDQIAYLSVTWQTNYDPDQMFVDLWRNRTNGSVEQVWSQRQGGLQFGTDHVAFDTVLEGDYFFKINVVPEPSSLLPLLTGIAGLAFLKRRV